MDALCIECVQNLLLFDKVHDKSDCSREHERRLAQRLPTIIGIKGNLRLNVVSPSYMARISKGEEPYSGY